MNRSLLAMMLTLLLSGNAWSQDTETAEEADAADAGAEVSGEEERDDSDLDEESYADADEEDFVPSEDIPTDQAIPFPTDI